MTPDPAESARLALYCMAAEDCGPFHMPAVAAQEGQGAVISGGPPLPAWMSDYALLGWLTGRDSWFEGILNLGAHTVFYGWLLQGPGPLPTLVIRGTEGAAEWAIDSQIVPITDHAVKGRVETGFWSLYKTLGFRDLQGRDITLAEALPHGATVTGHSLGAAVATFVTLELAERGLPARGRFIASPHPGDADFAAYFASLVTDYAVYARPNDIVPTVPGGLGYCALPNLITVAPTGRVRDTIVCNHHASSYADEIHEPTVKALPPGANRFASCLLA